LRRVYDNEIRIAADDEALTLFDIIDSVSKAVWKELDEAPEGEFSERKPAISSLRRNLQSEHLDRLIDLTKTSRFSSAAMKPISNLSAMKLRDLKSKIAEAAGNDSYDAYTKSHLQDATEKIEKWMDSKYVMN
ncbi:MAG: hypothetical protein AAGA30_21435, partial [Planctomycetota bacterium]